MRSKKLVINFLKSNLNIKQKEVVKHFNIIGFKKTTIYRYIKDYEQSNKVKNKLKKAFPINKKKKKKI